jgi:dTDP-4-amino-4,6-dideoxygalactose transaminase
MITTDDEQLARRAKHLTTQARLPGIEYRHDEVGYNYRLTNVAAALGVAQLEELPEFVRKKHLIAARYDEAFAGVPGLTVPPRPAWCTPSMWLYTILVDPEKFGCDRTELMHRLQQAGALSRPIWSPLHTMPMFRESQRLGGEVAEELFARGLSIPCSVGLREADQARVIDAVLSAARHR